MQQPDNVGKLFLIPTVLAPHTENQVLSPEILDVIANTKHFMVEEVRTARRYISSLKLGIVIEDLTFYELNKKTPPAALDKYFRALMKGNDIGVLSEAGCPGIADPGSIAVAYAHRKNIRVIPLVGPSSILLALMASGFNGQSFIFHGYLPIEKPAKAKAIKAIEKEAKGKKQTQIFMETPFRNDSMFTELLETCYPETMLCIAANVTAPDEFIQTKSIKEWREGSAPELHKIPTIFLLYI